MATGTIKYMGKKLIATASANETYYTQTNALTSYFNSLTDRQKEEAYIISGTAKYLSMGTSGSFMAFDGGATGIVANSLNVVAHSAYKITGTNATSTVNNTNSNTLYLYA